MKQPFLFFLNCLLSLCSFSQLIVGKKVSDLPGRLLKDSSISLLTEPAQFEDARILVIDSIFYEIVATENGSISFISTNHPRFKTKEGIQVGDTYLEVKQKSHRA